MERAELPVSLRQCQSVATVSVIDSLNSFRTNRALLSPSIGERYPALRSFLEKHRFPKGTMNLRKFSWSLKFLHPADSYKIDTITEIINSYPQRKYVCVGDSGELDPETYSKLYTAFPQAIVHIYIRDICSLPTCLPTCEERYSKAFEGIPKSRWTIFKDPKEMEADVTKLIACQ